MDLSSADKQPPSLAQRARDGELEYPIDALHAQTSLATLNWLWPVIWKSLPDDYPQLWRDVLTDEYEKQRRKIAERLPNGF